MGPGDRLSDELPGDDAILLSHGWAEERGARACLTAKAQRDPLRPIALPWLAPVIFISHHVLKERAQEGWRT